jgi:hypothetical protein
MLRVMILVAVVARLVARLTAAVANNENDSVLTKFKSKATAKE